MKPLKKSGVGMTPSFSGHSMAPASLCEYSIIKIQLSVFFACPDDLGWDPCLASPISRVVHTEGQFSHVYKHQVEAIGIHL